METGKRKQWWGGLAGLWKRLDVIEWWLVRLVQPGAFSSFSHIYFIYYLLGKERFNFLRASVRHLPCLYILCYCYLYYCKKPKTGRGYVVRSLKLRQWAPFLCNFNLCRLPQLKSHLWHTIAPPVFKTCMLNLTCSARMQVWAPLF